MSSARFVYRVTLANSAVALLYRYEIEEGNVGQNTYMRLNFFRASCESQNACDDKTIGARRLSRFGPRDLVRDQQTDLYVRMA